MESLLAIFAGSAASSGIEAVKQAAAAATRPFAEILSSLSGASESAPDDHDDSALQERIALRLQDILETAGVPAGECATVRFHQSSGEVDVDHGPLGADAEAAIMADDQLMDDLRQIAESDGEEDALELLIQVA